MRVSVRFEPRCRSDFDALLLDVKVSWRHFGVGVTTGERPRVTTLVLNPTVTLDLATPLSLTLTQLDILLIQAGNLYLQSTLQPSAGTSRRAH